MFDFILYFSLISLSSSSYVAVFLPDNMKMFLKENIFHFHNNSSPFNGNTRHIYCDHSTLEFSPKSDAMNEYKLHFGHVQHMKVLAYAEDENAQAILIHPIGDKDNHISINQYPHITISVSDIKPYEPVYSNDLWKRFMDNQIVQMQFDEKDKPKSIVLKDDENIREWNGKLTGNSKYVETQAYLKIFDDNIDLYGIVCVDNLWKNNKCQKN
uniref:Uncharacterized protein n=1 Tax=Philodina roseola TaxID=96448 RepID=B3G4N7_PHIRO|nr:unknown [Philodina roseola]